MSHYSIAKEAIDAAVTEATGAGWSEQELLQAVIVTALERHKSVASPKETVELLKYEMSNLGGGVDFDFVRSR